jgi:hypothetical protein
MHLQKVRAHNRGVLIGEQPQSGAANWPNGQGHHCCKGEGNGKAEGSKSPEGRIYESNGLRDEGRISLTVCQLNQGQARA